MSNPLALFRKHQKVLLVVFGVALMLVFTVGSIVSQWVAEPVGASRGDTVVEMKGGSLSEAEMQAMRSNRYNLRRFMHAIREYSAAQGATPKQNIVIPDTMDENSLLQTSVLASRAKNMGIKLSDESVVKFLEQYTENSLSGNDFDQVLRSVTNNRMPERQFLEAMKQELLAVRLRRLFVNGMLPTTPAVAWDYYQRLNRQISFEAVPFKAEEFLAQVDEPSAARVSEVFEEGKERYQTPFSPDFGFRRPRKVAIQWVRADLGDYLTKAKAEISDEEVLAFYEANKEDFKNISLPSFEDSTDPIDLSLPGIDDPSESSDLGSQDGDATETAESDPESVETEEPAETDPADAASDEIEATTDGASEESSVEQPSVDDDSATDASSDESESDGQPDPADQGSISDRHLTRVTALQETDGAEVDAADTIQAEDAEAEVVSEEEVTDAANGDSDDAEVANETAFDETDEQPAENTAEATDDAADDNAADDNAADSAEEEDPLAGLPEDAGGAEQRPEYKPLSEVEDEIRNRLAAPIARQKLDSALGLMRAEMKGHYGKFLADPDRQEDDKPEVPDLTAAASGFNFTTGRTPLISSLDLIEDDPITGKRRYEISSAFDQSGVSFVSRVFSDRLGLFQVQSIRAGVNDVEFLYWKTDEVEESIPELDEVRDEVVRAIKLDDAFKLAEKAAQEAIDKMKSDGQTPAAEFADDVNRKVITAQSVTWMTGANVPMLPPRQTQIEGLKFIDDKFMEPVFALGANRAVVASDAARKTAFAVMVTSVDSDDAQLRDRFVASQVRPYSDAELLAMLETQGYVQEWYRGVEKELEIDWKRDARPDGR